MVTTRRNVVIGIAVVLIVIGVAIAVVTLVGPALAPVRACTMMGCFDTLKIRFDGFQPERFRVEVNTPDGETYRFDCPDNSAGGFNQCNPDGVNLSEASPDDITVKVSWEGGSKTETFHVSYEAFQPNGPQCEPTCRSGEVVMTLP